MACPNHRPESSPVATLSPDYDRIARRIGAKLREMYGAPEAAALPADHVDLLLRLRHKERDQMRARGV
ncbi:hypothetical protein [Enterovirga rhinocerotis]|uniref:hypothetical protein n=1 Tax=Enterovirga rhinocerotis TaxID=1339210 RepID=UPI00105D8A2E|nr:hypothetical protein [Enterovirga rhinocerotis]